MEGSEDNTDINFIEELNYISPEVVNDNNNTSENDERIVFEENVNLKTSTLEDLYYKRYNLNTKLRKSVIKWVQDVVSIWVSVVLIILCLNNSMIKISDNVMIVLLSTTTINVLGLMAIAMKDIFNGKSEDKK